MKSPADTLLPDAIAPVDDNAPSKERRSAIVVDLFTTHANKVRRYLSWRLRSSEDAKDATQEVFLRLWRQERDGALRDEASGYMRAATSSAAIDVERWRARHSSELLADDNPESIPSHSCSSEELQHWRDAMVTFVEGVKALPPRLRDVFVLHHVKGLTFPELARELGISVRSAERYMAQAVDLLQERMQEYL